jgi:nucleoside-diphosphate-sugar epimerase
VSSAPLVAVTGASGYLGGLVARRFEAEGWQVRRLVRRPGDDPTARHYEIAGDPAPDLLESVDVLVHAAYDFAVTRQADIWRVNVDGSRRLISTAGRAGVRRIVVLSTMSAYLGTTQLYGRAKLAIEAATEAAGGCALRPGLVYGEHPGGMAGALRRMTRLPLVPLVGGDARQYPVHEDDLIDAIFAVAVADPLPRGPIGVAQPDPVTFRAILEAFAAAEGRRCRFVPFPWQALYWALRLAELTPAPLPFRADSLLGLVHSAPGVPGFDVLTGLGVKIRPFAA